MAKKPIPSPKGRHATPVNKGIARGTGSWLENNYFVLSRLLIVVIMSLLCIGAAIALWKSEKYFLMANMLALGLVFLIIVGILVGGGKTREVKSSKPAQRAIPKAFGNFIEEILPPGFYLELLLFYKLEVVDVNPVIAEFKIENVFTRPREDHPQAKTMSDDEIREIPMEIGGGSVHGEAVATLVPDYDSPKRLIQYIVNGGQDPEGSMAFAKKRLEETVNLVLDELGKIFTWKSLSSSTELAAVRIVRMVTGVTPRNFWKKKFIKEALIDKKTGKIKKEIHQQMGGLKIDVAPDIEDFTNVMGIIGFPDVNGLGVRLKKLTIDLEPEEPIKKRAAGIATEELDRQKEFMDNRTQFKLVNTGIKLFKKNNIDLEKADVFKLINFVQSNQGRAQRFIVDGDGNMLGLAAALGLKLNEGGGKGKGKGKGK